MHNFKIGDRVRVTWEEGSPPSPPSIVVVVDFTGLKLVLEHQRLRMKSEFRARDGAWYAPDGSRCKIEPWGDAAVFDLGQYVRLVNIAHTEGPLTMRVVSQTTSWLVVENDAVGLLHVKVNLHHRSGDIFVGPNEQAYRVSLAENSVDLSAERQANIEKPISVQRVKGWRTAIESVLDLMNDMEWDKSDPIYKGVQETFDDIDAWL